MDLYQFHWMTKNFLNSITCLRAPLRIEIWDLKVSAIVHMQHSGIFHISLGCWVLFTFGPRVCRAYGSFSFLLIYILGGIAGNLTSFLQTPEPTVGGTVSRTALFPFSLFDQYLFVIYTSFWLLFVILLAYVLSHLIPRLSQKILTWLRHCTH